jgi:hypothetical protein
LVRTHLGDIVTPVLHALDDIEPVLGVPPAAQAALRALKSVMIGEERLE